MGDNKENNIDFVISGAENGTVRAVEIKIFHGNTSYTGI